MRLSICIPTYNRADKLPGLLDSIAAQDGHGLELEVAISDNASTDDTPAVVERYRAAGMAITYHRQAENRGFDRNLLQSVAIASGTFCWLFGSDDLLEPGALAALSHAIGRHPDAAGFCVGLQGYTADLGRKIKVGNQMATTFTKETVLEGREAVIDAIGTCLGYMSALVIRRERWEAAAAGHPIERQLAGYVHTYVVARMLDPGQRWVCLPDRLVGYRTGNESFLGRDEFARTRLDIVGYDLAYGDTLGRDSPVYHRAMARVATVCVADHFLGAKLAGASSRYWRQAIPTGVAHYWRYPRFWLRTLPVALVPRPALLALRGLKRQVRG
jgi:abequosyltransferase